jgi:hypothetical protein
MYPSANEIHVPLFIDYCRENTKRIQKEYPNITHSNIIRILNNEWLAMSDIERFNHKNKRDCAKP